MLESWELKELFVCSQCVHVGSGQFLFSCSNETGRLSPRVKRRGCKSNHSPPSLAYFKNEWNCPPTALHVLFSTQGQLDLRMQIRKGNGKGRGKRNGKVQPGIGHKGPEGEKRYSSTLPLTSALDGNGW